ncbi:MAG: TonB-dependent receptor [Proteobacteria bacterium]|nr:TonB-dependent receptor [Pseudomonadota bacterium]
MPPGDVAPAPETKADVANYKLDSKGMYDLCLQGNHCPSGGPRAGSIDGQHRKGSQQVHKTFSGYVWAGAAFVLPALLSFASAFAQDNAPDTNRQPDGEDVATHETGRTGETRPAQAQQSAPASSPRSRDKKIEEIVVTGSLFNRPSAYKGRSPIQSLDRADLSGAGVTQTSDVLKTLTVNTGSTLAVEQSAAQGTSQFSLRGLGLGSSLTLINGRRAGLAPVSNGAGHFFFDINSLPVNMIERIDVLTDGASATYGSEAVAGVANIITRSQFEGFEISGGASNASNRSYDLGLAFGADHDKGHIGVFGAYYRQTANFRTDFDWIVDRVTKPGGDYLSGRHTSSVGSPGSYNLAVPDFMTGRFQRAPNAIQVPDVDCEAAGGILSATGDTCKFLFADQVTVIPDEQRAQVFVEGSYELGDQVEFFTEVSHSVNKITDRLGAAQFNNGSIVGGQGIHIPGDHPFNFWIADPVTPGGLLYVPPTDPGWANGTLQAADLAATMRPLGNEANGPGAAKRLREFRNTRFLTGLKLDLGHTWSADISGMVADNEFTGHEPRNYLADVFNQLVLEGRWNPFGTRLANPDLVSPKPGSQGVTAANAPEIQAQFDGVGVQSRRMQMKVLEAHARGDVVQTPLGVVPLAVGVQYRSLDYQRTPDSLEAAAEANGRDKELQIKGAQDVYALFAESVIPLGQIGEMQLAGRYEDYGGGMNTVDPKVATEIRPLEWLRLRGSWGTSFQAPTMTQVAGEQTSRSLSDPEVREMGQSVCRMNSGENFNTVEKRVGSPDLEPQSANNFNLGLVVAPVRSLRFAVDFWNYRYHGLIGLDANGQTLVDNTCLNQDGTFREGLAPNPDPRVVRNAAGQLLSTTSNFINVGQVRASGLDLNASYGLQTPGTGSFDLRLAATLLTQFEADVDGDGNFENRRGYRNSDLDAFAPQPQLRAVLSGSWALGGHAAHLAVRYIGGFKQDEKPLRAVDSMEITSRVAPWTTLDAQYALRLSGVVEGGESVLVVGANNVLDQDPPGLPADGVIRPGYEGTVHDIRGRLVYVKLKHTFL